MDYSKIPRGPGNSDRQKCHFEMSPNCCPINSYSGMNNQAHTGKQHEQMVHLMTEVRPTLPGRGRHD